MVKAELFDLPINHRLFVFNYVNLIYSALSNSDFAFSNDIKIERINHFLEQSLPGRPGTFSNFPVGQAYIQSIYKILLEDLSEEEQIMYTFKLASNCPENRHRLLEQLIKVNSNLAHGLEDLANFYNLINPIHFVMLYPDSICLYTKYPQLDYDLASLTFELSWIIKTLSRSFQLPERKFSDLEFGEKYICLPLRKNELKLKSSRPDKNLRKILHRQAHDTLKQLFGFDHTSVKHKRLGLGIEFVLNNIQASQISLGKMASYFGLSERTLQRRLDHRGISFTELILFMRMEIAKQMLEVPIFKVTDIAQGLGYSESSAFTRAFKKSEGISPLKYRKKFTN